MNFDASVFDTAYEAFAHDIVEKLKYIYPKYDIQTTQKHYQLEDEIILYINDKQFNFDLMQYLDDSAEIGEPTTFSKLQIQIQLLLQSPHI